VSGAPQLSVDVFGRTDVGCVRADNQDSFLVGDLDRGALITPGDALMVPDRGRGPVLVVCDGMGGVAGGEVASDLAARVMWGQMIEAASADDRHVYGRLLRRAARVANRRIWEEGRTHKHLRGMGTTMSAAGLAGSTVVLAQVGDSRAYLHRGQTLTQVTRDQSVVSALVHAGRITADEARDSIHANVILQALGVAKDVEVSLSVVELRRGDRLLLCSDGLHGPVSDDEILAILEEIPDVREAVETMVEEARAAGGPDNITAVLAAFDGEALAAPASPEDLPRFIELDPGEEGERALTDTSWVARRLAARAGVVDDPGPPVVPATGQYSMLRVPPTRPPRPRSAGDTAPLGPAGAALAERARVRPWMWVAAVLCAVLVFLLVLFDVL
jgi:PPM family protein phosphatase